MSIKIKTKLFRDRYIDENGMKKYVNIDVQMNQFLEINDIELINIKYTSTVNTRDSVEYSALMIYKERE